MKMLISLKRTLRMYWLKGGRLHRFFFMPFLLATVFALSVSGQEHSFPAAAQEHLPSISLARELLQLGQDSAGLKGKKSFEKTDNDAYLLLGINHLWEKTADGIYFRFVQGKVNRFLARNEKGRDLGADVSLPALQYGRSMLSLYKVTGHPNYYQVATQLWQLMQKQGHFGDDDFSIALPFYVEYAALVCDTSAFDTLTDQLKLKEKEIEQWRLRREYALRIGQYGLALVEVLDCLPDSKNREVVLQLLKRCTVRMEEIVKQKPGSWVGLEAQTRCIYLYTLAKASRLGYIEGPAKVNIEAGYKSIIATNAPPEGIYKYDGFDSQNKGLWLLAINEYELYNLPKPGMGHVILLDSFFNNETKTDQSRNTIPWHYKWDEKGDNGFSTWAGQFQRAGYRTTTLYNRPTKSNLKNAAVYVIVDPDTEKENKHPNYIKEEDIEAIVNWVKSGGVLLLMANDSANTELEKFNMLAASFGVSFNKDSKGKVIGNQFDMGKITIHRTNPMFSTAKAVFIKEFSSLHLTGSAQSILKDKDGNVVVATVKFGKGAGLFIGDPWLYNEYVDGRKLPTEYDNFNAGDDIIHWINKHLPSSAQW
jgi:unsaturated rhamnogalacturonyl hydrolase